MYDATIYLKCYFLYDNNNICVLDIQQFSVFSSINFQISHIFYIYYGNLLKTLPV
jgi:hypothetical protein